MECSPDRSLENSFPCVPVKPFWLNYSSFCSQGHHFEQLPHFPRVNEALEICHNISALTSGGIFAKFLRPRFNTERGQELSLGYRSGNNRSLFGDSLKGAKIDVSGDVFFSGILQKSGILMS